jgi:hypothetical protein
LPKLLDGAAHLHVEPLFEQGESSLLLQAQDGAELAHDGSLTPLEVDFGAIQLFESRLDLYLSQGPLPQEFGKRISQQALPAVEFPARRLQLRQFGKKLGRLIFGEIERLGHLPDLDRFDQAPPLRRPSPARSRRGKRLAHRRRHREHEAEQTASDQCESATPG